MKKIIAIIVLLFCSSLLFAANVGFGITSNTTVVNVIANKEQAFLDFDRFYVNNEIRFLGVLGTNIGASYDYQTGLDTLEFGGKVYLPLLLVMPNVGVNIVKYIDNFSSTYYNFSAGLEVGFLKMLTISASIFYYGDDYNTMFNTIMNKDVNEIIKNSYANVGIKLWL
jgi:hypothetical protein